VVQADIVPTLVICISNSMRAHGDGLEQAGKDSECAGRHDY
jgi:hypothetical protein